MLTWTWNSEQNLNVTFKDPLNVTVRSRVLTPRPLFLFFIYCRQYLYTDEYVSRLFPVFNNLLMFYISNKYKYIYIYILYIYIYIYIC